MGWVGLKCLFNLKTFDPQAGLAGLTNHFIKKFKILFTAATLMIFKNAVTFTYNLSSTFSIVTQAAAYNYTREMLFPIFFS